MFASPGPQKRFPEHPDFEVHDKVFGAESLGVGGGNPGR